MATSRFVCARCGLAVYRCGSVRGRLFWKHAAGGRSAVSCRQTPDPMPRAEFDRQARLLAQVVDAMR
ncbi:hypothetical protein BAY61_32035 (plasmid) [Prauserella marina]|uniref:Uncharacterized protein n=1 Tax=Prauserella marina TaxID=530584 RepID=A0A222W190_9PSEU|nr:hypothetical protein BAY61_32035 [Prauserella marina]PWV71415.1 hypothetical protein DES30_112131 [Prauserella marina]SDD98177.1 hypothetical protein SAMN05421630_115148 [Prauserella marina]